MVGLPATIKLIDYEQNPMKYMLDMATKAVSKLLGVPSTPGDSLPINGVIDTVISQGTITVPIGMTVSFGNASSVQGTLSVREACQSEK